MKLILMSRGLEGTYGTRFLKETIPAEVVAGKRILVVSLPDYNTDALYVQNCLEWGFAKEDIVLSEEYASQAATEFDYVYVTAGNTFEVLAYLQQKGLLEVICRIALEGVYIGASAGAMIAGKDIRLAADFDENFVRLSEDEQQGLGLFEGTIIPHYSYSEYRYYLASKPPVALERYEAVYYVSDIEVLKLEKMEADELWKEKRIRWECE